VYEHYLETDSSEFGTQAALKGRINEVFLAEVESWAMLKGTERIGTVAKEDRAGSFSKCAPAKSNLKSSA
jgi:hypothetical protein